MGFVVRYRDGNPFNCPPSNLLVLGAKGVRLHGARNSYAAVWAVRIRLKAVLAGENPDMAMKAARADWLLKHSKVGHSELPPPEPI